MVHINGLTKSVLLNSLNPATSLLLLSTWLTGCSLAGLQEDARILEVRRGNTTFLHAEWRTPASSLYATDKERSRAKEIRYAGKVADLSDDIFSPMQGRKGYWSSREFLNDVGANIYTLEEYDPARIPILFVHGAAGSPQDWRYFFTHIDRRRYQAWVFYYPSGAPVSTVTALLRQNILEIQATHRLSKIYITAHSMGGLVVRSLLAEYGASLPPVKLFVSLATPWGGERFAELGARLTSTVPSWKDLRPQGSFLNNLFAEPLPEGTDYYLFFGYQGSRSITRPNNDGTITLESLLRREAQAEAKQIYGFDENHTSILASQEVMASYNALLRLTDEMAEQAPVH